MLSSMFFVDVQRESCQIYDLLEGRGVMRTKRKCSSVIVEEMSRPSNEFAVDILKCRFDRCAPICAFSQFWPFNLGFFKWRNYAIQIFVLLHI